MCSECENEFECQEELIRHESTHKPKETQFKCTECDLMCSSNELLEKHMSTHTEEKPFQCNKCEESFEFEGQLNMHMQNHSAENIIDVTQGEINDGSLAEWVGKPSFVEVIKSPPKQMTSTPKVMSASQPCRSAAMEKSTQKQKRCLSSSPENVQENKKHAREYTREYTRESFLKKPASKEDKPGKKSNKKYGYGY